MCITKIVNNINFNKIICEFKNKYYLNNNIALYSLLNNIIFKIKNNIIYLYFYSYTSMKFFESIKEKFLFFLCKKLSNNNIKIILKIYNDHYIKDCKPNSSNIINNLLKENSQFLIMIKILDLEILD